MAENEQEKPKIIIDDDWKKQAQAEKEKLAEETEKKAESAGPAGGREFPPADFTSLVSMLTTQAIVALGGMQDPSQGKVTVDPAMAKHCIDTMEMLKEKTKGNLTDDEAKVLEDALYQSQMFFVQISKRIAEAQAQGKVVTDNPQE